VQPGYAVPGVPQDAAQQYPPAGYPAYPSAPPGYQPYPQQPGVYQHPYAQPGAGGYPPYSPQGAGYYPGVVEPRGLSIASMICGIAGVVLSLLSIGFLPGLAAVILGHIAAKKQPSAKAFWLTGIVTGYVAIAIGLIFLAFVIIGLASVYGGY